MYSYHHAHQGTKLYKPKVCKWRVCGWWGRCYCLWYGSANYYAKRSVGCYDHSGTWSVWISAHSMDTYHANT
jgi:hypothetical protein